MDENLSKNDLNLILEIIHGSLTCENTIEFCQLIHKTKSLLEVSHVRSLIGDLSKYKTEKMNAFKMFTEFPMMWEKRYHEKNYIFSDNIALTAFHQKGLIYWRDFVELQYVDDESNKKSRKISKEAASAGLKDGWLYSMGGQRSTAYAILSFSDKKCNKCERSRKIIEYLSPHLCLTMERMFLSREKMNVKLTARECDVLTWIAKGKTAWEISVILKISNRTVEFHIGNIKRKFNAVNTQHAIAKAFSAGVLA